MFDRRLATVDGDRRAADPACARGGEKRDDGADFVGAAEAAERQLALDELGDALADRPAAACATTRRETGSSRARRC